MSENTLPIEKFDKISLREVIMQIYDNLFCKDKEKLEKKLINDINKYISDNVLISREFINFIIFNYLLLIDQCNDQKITRKQLVSNLRTFMHYQKSSERNDLENNGNGGNGGSQDPNLKKETSKRKIKSKEEKIAEKKESLSRMRKKCSQLSIDINKLEKELGIKEKEVKEVKKKGEKKEVRKKEENPKEAENQELLNKRIAEGDYGGEIDEETKFEKVEDEPAYQTEEGSVISGGFGILEETEEKIEFPDIANYTNYKICREQTLRIDINLSIKKIKLTQNNIIDSSGVYHSAPIENIGPKKSKFTWDSITTFIFAFVGLSLPLSRIAKMIYIPEVLKRMTGTALAEIVEKQVKNFIPIYEHMFKLFAEMSYINADDHPVQNEEHDAYMKELRNLASNYSQDLIKKDKSINKEYHEKLSEIQKPWDAFKNEENSLSSLKKLKDLEEEKIENDIEMKKYIEMLKQDGNYTPDQESILKRKRENMQFEREKRKIEISAKLSSFLGFESQCKTENIYFSGFKTSLNLTVLTGRLDIHNPQSRLVFFRTHLGSVGNLLNQVFIQRSKLLNEEEKLSFNKVLPKYITIQADSSSNNLIEQKYQKDALYVGCLAHLRRHFIKEAKLIPHFKKLAIEAEEKCDYLREKELEKELEELLAKNQHNPEKSKTLAELRGYNKIYSLQIILDHLQFLMDNTELELKGFTKENVTKHREDLQKTFVCLRTSFDLFEDYWEENSNFMKGCKYFRSNMLSFFNIYCDPYVSLTNNISERLLRSPVLLEKAQSRRKSYSSAFVLDIFRSIIATCEAAKISVRKYIIAILKADYHDIVNNPANYLPHVMKERL